VCALCISQAYQYRRPALFVKASVGRASSMSASRGEKGRRCPGASAMADFARAMVDRLAAALYFRVEYPSTS
jgi:hypothetical protein